MTDAAVSRAIDVLGVRGRRDRRHAKGHNFVEIKFDPNNRRIKYLFLTPSGLSFLELIENHLWSDQ